jgi:anaphase-promoting complex subunit 10
MSVHDIQEFAEMSFEQPTGWIDVDFSGVGPIEATPDQEGESLKDIDWSKRPVLRAFLVQVRILENHQNGKDTHLRAVQLFARDETQQSRRSQRVSDHMTSSLPMRAAAKSGKRQSQSNSIKLAPWMMDPDLR